MQKYTAETLYDWLTHTQSLTQKLKQQSGDAVLQIRAEIWRQPDNWDMLHFRLPAEPVFCREIVMLAHDVPCWYAKSIFPSHTYTQHKALFARLEHETLGELIFNGDEIVRQSLQTVSIHPSSELYASLSATMQQHPPKLLARLSTFVVAHHACFYLLEVLLPGLLRYCP